MKKPPSERGSGPGIVVESCPGQHPMCLVAQMWPDLVRARGYMLLLRASRKQHVKEGVRQGRLT